MEQLKQQLENILTAGGFSYSLEVDSDLHKVSLFLHDESIKDQVLRLLNDWEHVVKIIGKKSGLEKVNFDLNNYKKERERLIVELAKAAARKVLLEKKDIELPVMNAYERRLVHVELAARPDVKTESIGEGTVRHIVVKLL